MSWSDPLATLLPWMPRWARQAAAVFLALFALYALRLVILAVT